MKFDVLVVLCTIDSHVIFDYDVQELFIYLFIVKKKTHCDSVKHTFSTNLIKSLKTKEQKIFQAK